MERGLIVEDELIDRKMDAMQEARDDDAAACFDVSAGRSGLVAGAAAASGHSYLLSHPGRRESDAAAPTVFRHNESTGISLAVACDNNDIDVSPYHCYDDVIVNAT